MEKEKSPESFFKFLEEWLDKLPDLPISQLAAQPARVAILSVDMIKGFCTTGPLSSPRIASIILPITDLFKSVWEAGIHHILLIQDTHDPEAVEFGAFPPHCVRGTEESEAPDEFKNLPFYKKMVVIPKNSIASEINTDLSAWMATHPEVDTFIVVGDCTDICVHELVTFLRAEADAYQMERRVIVPENCVETYDRPVSVARQQGGLPHPADLLQDIFLYHMALQGAEIVKRIV
ncbi:MAG: cysteine hydrolase [Anaerolineae bacterium]|nr:cysteine hydrolase [Anaerolineae bacterium]